ncbi:MAG: type II toxin-antitoxin system RelE/ParE family toxin [Terriglobales bacterium]
MSRSLKLRLTETAEADLTEIWSYLAGAASESSATEFLSQIQARCGQVSVLPRSGAPRFHLAADLRVIFHRKYAIYYLVRVDEIIVVRVLHGSRDIAHIAAEGGFAI